MGMKYFIVLAGLIALNSCNTLIGIGRDTKQGYLWTKEKIQNAGNKGGGNGGNNNGAGNSGTNSGAPVY